MCTNIGLCSLTTEDVFSFQSSMMFTDTLLYISTHYARYNYTNLDQLYIAPVNSTH